MAAYITTKHDCVILDACCVMNLYASGKMDEIVSTITETITVAVYVLQNEALTVYLESKSATPDKREIINLQPLIDKGLLITAQLETEEEKTELVRLSQQRLDDGEAETIAIACNRNWAVATDDRLAKRILGIEYKNLQVISTPDILVHWQENKKPGISTVRDALLNIELRANFVLGQRHPLYKWWQSYKQY